MTKVRAIVSKLRAIELRAIVMRVEGGGDESQSFDIMKTMCERDS
jgi:hypothetical protein